MIQPLPIEDVLSKVEVIASALEQASNILPSDLDGLAKYLQDLISYQALVTEVHASVKFHLLSKKEEVLNKILKAEIEGVKKDGSIVTVKVSPSIQKIFAECRVKEYEYLYLKTERLCSNVSHALEATRSLISNAKQEKYYSHQNN
jgi:hypothetical protein